MSASGGLPDDYVGHAMVGQIGGRGSKHVIWVNNRFGSRAAAYPPEGICDDRTWATAEPLYGAADLAAHDQDTAHAVALERERAAAMVSAQGDEAQGYIFQGPAEARRLWDLAASIRNGDHWKDGAK